MNLNKHFVIRSLVRCQKSRLNGQSVSTHRHCMQCLTSPSTVQHRDDSEIINNDDFFMTFIQWDLAQTPLILTDKEDLFFLTVLV